MASKQTEAMRESSHPEAGSDGAQNLSAIDTFNKAIDRYFDEPVAAQVKKLPQLETKTRSQLRQDFKIIQGRENPYLTGFCDLEDYEDLFHQAPRYESSSDILEDAAEQGETLTELEEMTQSQFRRDSEKIHVEMNPYPVSFIDECEKLSQQEPRCEAFNNHTATRQEFYRRQYGDDLKAQVDNANSTGPPKTKRAADIKQNDNDSDEEVTIRKVRTKISRRNLARRLSHEVKLAAKPKVTKIVHLDLINALRKRLGYLVEEASKKEDTMYEISELGETGHKKHSAKAKPYCDALFDGEGPLNSKEDTGSIAVYTSGGDSRTDTDTDSTIPSSSAPLIHRIKAYRAHARQKCNAIKVQRAINISSRASKLLPRIQAESDSKILAGTAKTRTSDAPEVAKPTSAEVQLKAAMLERGRLVSELAKARAEVEHLEEELEE